DATSGMTAPSGTAPASLATTTGASPPACGRGRATPPPRTNQRSGKRSRSSGRARRIRPIVSARVSDPRCRDPFSRAVARAVGEAVDADTRNVLILDRGRPIELGVLARAADVRPKQRHLPVLQQQIRLVAGPAQDIDGVIEPRRPYEVPPRGHPAAVQPHAAALNLAQYDRVRRQRPANLFADGRISMFGALNVEHTQTARLDHVPDRQQPAQ